MPLPASEVKAFIDSSYDKKGTPVIGDYKLDTQLSTRKAKVYYSPSEDKVVIANRGTVPTMADWANNARYIVGDYKNTGRMKQAEAVQRGAIQKYGHVDTNVAHSQSGIIARNLNSKGLTGEVISYNPASMFEKQKKNEHVVRSKNDLVSSLHMLNPRAKSNRTTTLKGVYNPVSTHLSGVLDQLNPARLLGGSTNIDNMMTNDDIDDYMYDLKIKDYHGCFLKDELPELNKGFYVINLNGHSHWTALYKGVDKNGNKSYLYFDSFGFPAPTEVEQAIKKDSYPEKRANYTILDKQLQDIDHTSCGFFVIAWIKTLAKARGSKLKAYEKFIDLFHDVSTNDAEVKNIIED